MHFELVFTLTVLRWPGLFISCAFHIGIVAITFSTSGSRCAYHNCSTVKGKMRYCFENSAIYTQKMCLALSTSLLVQALEAIMLLVKLVHDPETSPKNSTSLVVIRSCSFGAMNSITLHRLSIDDVSLSLQVVQGCHVMRHV